MIPVPANSVDQFLGQIHSTATIFTQNPDTPHLLVVPFDARTTHVYQNPGGWRPLVFCHLRIGNTQRTYSAVLANGDRQHIAAPGSRHWMPQLLPRVYDYQNGSPRIQAGLVGSIPLLIALAAFSAPPNFLTEVLTNCLRPGQWRSHQYQYPAGRELVRSMFLVRSSSLRPDIAERGMVVTIFFDHTNPHGSDRVLLNRLERGDFGPFYS